MISYQLTTASIGIAFAVCVLFLVGKDLLHTRYSLQWLVVAGIVIPLAFVPRLSDWVAQHLGVAYPPTLILLLALVLLGVKCLVMDIDRSRQERDLRRLIQKVALLEGGRRERSDSD
ncbi:hypothetical protein GGQ74_002340 [Desulfobaculum xiamenense]|uniref:DUF2304 domain-containing protein n=1 Tax=Desulfobaculum xiamenense TaxID=995050 RepID=A0A846QNA1_9BACT|nr:DUF2304 domain-containing protein [Desulfobaculum xiamenense]NJB68667.1 hypothetical protein [Desulfobaculum xiamenense]